MWRRTEGENEWAEERFVGKREDLTGGEALKEERPPPPPIGEMMGEEEAAVRGEGGSR